MKRKRPRSRPDPPTVPPAAAGWPALSWIVAALLLITVPLVGLLPIYQIRFVPGLRQFARLPNRIHWSLDDVHRLLKPKAFPPLRLVRNESFEDAIVVTSDDPRDAPLDNLIWCAYYVYPRVVVNTDMLRKNPSITPDFLITTPHFPANLPDSARTYSMTALSPRADAHIRARQGR